MDRVVRTEFQSIMGVEVFLFTNGLELDPIHPIHHRSDSRQKNRDPKKQCFHFTYHLNDFNEVPNYHGVNINDRTVLLVISLWIQVTLDFS